MPRRRGQFPVGDFQGSVFVELLRDGTQVSLGGHSIFEAVHLGPFFVHRPTLLYGKLPFVWAC
ncbi:MAG TPA: hypothetical protein DCQ67_08215 [Acidimicrobiaceae bacterium]|nr:hypothetical protein [Acidimicrobiaceae bacterium]